MDVFCEWDFDDLATVAIKPDGHIYLHILCYQKQVAIEYITGTWANMMKIIVSRCGGDVYVIPVLADPKYA
jgi:hypothetical protein